MTDKTLRAAGIALVAVVAYALVVPMVVPAAWHEVSLAAARRAPSWAHWFGTDNAGRDLFVRVALGLRVSLLIAVVCAFTSTVLGVLVGTMAVFYVSGLYAEDRVLNRFRLSYSVVKATGLGLVFVASMVLFYRQFYVSRLLLVIYGAGLAALMIGLRLVLFAAFRRTRTDARRRRRVGGKGGRDA